MKVNIENPEPLRTEKFVSGAFFLLILQIIGNRVKGQEPDSSFDHPKIYSIHVQIGQNQTFSSIYPDYFINHQDKKNITIANALTMKTGINFIDGDHTRPLYETDQSSVDYILSLPGHTPAVICLTISMN
jgi:hypothetical protein